ncbi:unnamed protein product [Orchesella dallaii]|uniref:Uncharacterized protein n=1 Tax=Orchesella dallaii TaxID=48710 RepID=A0ABP1PPL1_9HEXA
MKFALVFTIVIVAVHGGSYRIRRQGGWSKPTTAPPPPPTTTPGWNPPETTTAPGWSPPPTTAPGWGPPPTTAPGWGPPETTTTPGWNPPETTTTAGWNPPPPTGWPSLPPPPPPPSGWGPPPPLPIGSSVVNLDADVAVVGAGWAGSSHGETVDATGNDAVQASVALASSGESLVDQNAAVVQVSSIDSNGAVGIQSVVGEQVADAIEGVAVYATGLTANVASTGWTGVAGQGASSAEGHNSVIIS